MQNNTYRDDLALAHVLADTADDISSARFRAEDLHVTEKPDNTPVTDADTAVEEALRGILSRTRPRDGVRGEEMAHLPAKGTRREWIIDPIDGTKNFLRGVPIWGTLIALYEGRLPAVGVVSAPALSRRWWAADGVGAFTGKNQHSATRLGVSGVAKLADASLSHSSLHSWKEAGRWEGFLSLTESVWRTRGYGDFYGHMLVAEGAVDISVEPELSLWDMAALVPIITEAGGRFTDLSGTHGPYGRSGVSSNGALHDAVLSALALER